MFMKGLKFSHAYIHLLALSLVLGAGYALVSRGGGLNAQTVASCGDIVIVDPVAGQTLSGTYTLTVANTQPALFPINEVTFLLEGDEIGSATATAGTSGLWHMSWNTLTANNGQYQLSAIVDFANSGGTAPEREDCMTDSVLITVSNTDDTQPKLELKVELVPGNWRGPTNVSVGFNAFAYLEDEKGALTDVTESAAFSWSTTIGSVDAVGASATFYSGPDDGSGQLVVSATYGGNTVTDNASLEVDKAKESDYPVGDDSSSDSDEQQVSTVLRQLINDSNGPLAAALISGGDTRLAKCIKLRLGERQDNTASNDSNDTISGGRLDFNQFIKARSCFTLSRNIVPANIAPVDPDKVPSLPRKRQAKISKVNNIATRQGQLGLLLTGQAEPSVPVLIYIYSNEPLVVTTTSDANGSWSYVLENPLEPGKHEAYVVLDDGGAPVRSEAVAFAIASTEANAQNPKGYSLVLASANADTDLATLYVAAGAALVLLTSVFLGRLVWFKRHHPLNSQISEITGQPLGMPKTDDETHTSPQDK